jgi:hypothetical protein
LLLPNKNVPDSMLVDSIVNSNLSKAGIEFKLFTTEDTQVNLKPDFTLNEYVNPGSTINEFIKSVQTTYLVILPKYIFLNENWLYDMFYYHCSFNNPGATLISDMDKGLLQPLLDKDLNLVDVYIPKIFNGTLMFDFGVINALGGFSDKYKNYPSCLNEYIARAQKLGKVCYNIPMQQSIIPKDFNDLFPDQIKEIKSTIQKTTDSLFIQLFSFTKNQIKANELLDSLIVSLNIPGNKAKKYQNKKTASFGLVMPYINEQHILEIKKFADTFDLTFSICVCDYETLKVLFITKN